MMPLHVSPASDTEFLIVPRPGYILCRQSEGVGRVYQQTFIDTSTKVAFAKLYDRKTPISAADLPDCRRFLL
jgi:hypothetical protein